MKKSLQTDDENLLHAKADDSKIRIRDQMPGRYIIKQRTGHLVARIRLNHPYHAATSCRRRRLGQAD
jgi:hypothetical protein